LLLALKDDKKGILERSLCALVEYRRYRRLRPQVKDRYIGSVSAARQEISNVRFRAEENLIFGLQRGLPGYILMNSAGV
jgi:hypothetical protein